MPRRNQKDHPRRSRPNHRRHSAKKGKQQGQLSRRKNRTTKEQSPSQ